jgi:hypothetical protein
MTEQAFRELAERLMGHPSFPDGPISAELFAGTLPDSLSLELPLPANGILLGSQLRRVAGRPASMEVVLDDDGEPAAIVAAYVTELKVAGWTKFEGFGGPRGGFISANTDEGAAMRKGDGPVLMVSAVEREGAPADVRVRLDWQLARHVRRGPPGPPPGADLLPPLRAPRGVALRGQHGGGGMGHFTSETTVQTEHSAPLLEAHFAAQLEEARWTRIDGGAAGDAIAWSSWQLPGDDGWRGLLLLLAPFGDDERTLTLRVETHEPADGEGNSYVELH